MRYTWTPEDGTTPPECEYCGAEPGQPHEPICPEVNRAGSLRETITMLGREKARLARVVELDAQAEAMLQAEVSRLTSELDRVRGENEGARAALREIKAMEMPTECAVKIARIVLRHVGVTPDAADRNP